MRAHWIVPLAMVFLLAGMALAHDPYTGLVNPKTRAICCNGHDCKPVAHSEIGESGAYYTYSAMRFPKDQSQPSFDERYHVCVAGGHAFQPRQIRCLLRPVPGS